MNTLIPTQADIDAAKADCTKQFGHSRLVGVQYFDPLTGEHRTTVLLAAFDWNAAVEYQDVRFGDVAKARALLFAERQMFPALEALGPLRAEWPAFALTVETLFRADQGFSPDDENPVTRPLTASSAPPGLDAEACKALLAAATGTRLWSVHLASNGLALVWKQPTPEMWSHAQRVIGEAERARQGILCPALGIMGDHCVWTPDGTLRQHLDAAPGRARDLEIPWTMLGGVAAKASAFRL